MADINYVKSIGDLVDAKALSSSLSWAASGASDSVTWTGISINRASFATGALPRSLDAVIYYDATLASGHSLSFYVAVQEGPDGTNWSDYATQAQTVVLTGVSGGARQVGVYRMPNESSNAPSGAKGVDLNGARQYVRVNVVPHMWTSGNDTAVIAAVGEFGGFDFLAAPTT